jgi:hypothetical protein
MNPSPNSKHKKVWAIQKDILPCKRNLRRKEKRCHAKEA